MKRMNLLTYFQSSKHKKAIDQMRQRLFERLNAPRNVISLQDIGSKIKYIEKVKVGNRV